MSLELLFRVTGLALLILGPSHLCLYRYFSWGEDSKKMTSLNGQIFLVHAFFIGLSVSLMGILFFFYPQTLLERSALGKLVLLGFLIFWGCRLFIQLFVYDSKLWKGNPLYTVVHILFTFFWTYLVALLAYAYGQVYRF